jgi:GT2 family glycosyltransferase
MKPTLSIVVPTHNRRNSLVRLLDAIERQEQPGSEVIVVSDGCSDDTAQTIRSRHWRIPVRLIEQFAAGPAAARNRGAAEADAPLILFLDDDMEPAAGTVQAHCDFHRHHRDAIGIGDLKPEVTEAGLFGVILRGWWHGMFEGMRRPGHRYTYRDLMSGHVSMGKALFDRLGRFDPSFRCHEDWELGYRAIAADVPLRLVPGAIAVHHETATLEKALGRKYDEGIADVQLLDRYPALASELPLSRQRVRKQRSRRGGRIPSFKARLAMRLYERFKLRFRWRQLLEDLLDDSYSQGVSATGRVLSGVEHRGGRSGTSRLPPELILDLACGLEAARQQLDATRPMSVRLTVSGSLIGDVPATPGSERLRGAHLSQLIARQFALQYLDAAARHGSLPPMLLRTPSDRRDTLEHPATA